MVPDVNILPTINENLPEQIRVIGLKKVSKGFNSKVACSSRVYEYLMPTYAYAPFKDTNLSYRISPEILSRIQRLLNKYHGTHNFHNFTSGKKYDDKSAVRFIMSFSIGLPFVANDIEFVSLNVEGQSFMLHQIRKMIGLIVAIVRDYLSEDSIEQAFNPHKLDIPRAPAVGLFLDEVRYAHYNRKFGNDGIHEKLDWIEYEDAVSSFKEKYILKHIIDTEVKEHTMLQWLQTLQLHDFHRSKIEEENKIEMNKTEESKVEINSLELDESKVEENKVEMNKLEESKFEENKVEMNKLELDESKVEESKVEENKVEMNKLELEESKVEESKVEENKVEMNKLEESKFEDTATKSFEYSTNETSHK